MGCLCTMWSCRGSWYFDSEHNTVKVYQRAACKGMIGLISVSVYLPWHDGYLWLVGCIVACRPQGSSCDFTMRSLVDSKAEQKLNDTIFLDELKTPATLHELHINPSIISSFFSSNICPVICGVIRAVLQPVSLRPHTSFVTQAKLTNALCY